MNSYDVVISGGGMVGCIAAIEAAHKGFNVLLVESGDVIKYDDSQRDLRVSTISKSNYQYLKEMGITNHIVKRKINPFHKMMVWDQTSQAKLNFEDDITAEPLGVLVENKNLIYACQQQIKSIDTIKLLTETKILEFKQDKRKVSLTLSNEEKASAKLLISCEGQNSPIREKLEITTSIHSYKQNGLVAYLKIEKASNDIAYQVFMNGGPLALLPFSSQLYSIVWSHSEKDTNELMNLDEPEFAQRISDAIGKDFGNVTLKSKRASFPLTSHHAENYYKDRVILCGDSAHGVHPLAGQGVNLGIKDVQWLFECVQKKSLKNTAELKQQLRKYQRRRISEVAEASNFMSFINYLFIDDNNLKEKVRAIGFDLINKTPLKKWFAQKAGS